MLIWSVGMIIGVQLGFESSFYVPDIAIISVFVITLSLLAIRTIFSKETAIIQQSTADETIKGIGLSTIGGFYCWHDWHWRRLNYGAFNWTIKIR